MKTKLHIGPAGWSYPDWEGIVYPRPKPRGFDPLAYLASYFNLIEVNSTFYRIPTRQMTRSWSERVAFRPDFMFTAKAYQELTHARSAAPLALVDDFKRAIEPLSDSGRLSAILVQFPWSFRCSDDAMKYIESLDRAFAPLPTAVEVRHGGWRSPQALSFFTNSGITMCGIDQPRIGESLDPDTHFNGRAGAYFRLHGRNNKAWFDRSAGRDERYNYLYTPEEVGEWSGRVRRDGEGAERIHVVLNNHFEGQATANALEMYANLTDEKPKAPDSLINRHPRLRVVAQNDDPPSQPNPQRSLFDDGN